MRSAFLGNTFSSKSSEGTPVMNAARRISSRIAMVLASFAAAALTGCGTAPQSGGLPVYRADAANRMMDEQVVSVLGVQVVKIKEESSNFSNQVATLAGSVIGGAIANNVGKGRGRTLATAAGAGIGGIAGSVVEEAGSYQIGLAYSISFKDYSGNMVRKTIVQPLDNTINHIAPGWRPGAPFPRTRARLVQGYNGDRLLPL